MRPHSTRLTLGCIFLFFGSFALRWSVIAFSSDSLRDDPDAYRALALVWESTGTFGQLHNEKSRPTAFRPPLYPALLTLLVQRDASNTPFLPASTTGILHALLGALTSVGASLCFYIFSQYGSRLQTAELERRRWLGSLVPGVLVACDPILIRQSQLIMTETFATFLLTLTMLGLLWRSSCPNPLHSRTQLAWDFCLGLLFGLQCLCRPTALAWLILWLAGSSLLMLHRSRDSRKRGANSLPKLQSMPRFFNNASSWLYSTLAYLTGTLLVLLPWGLRNANEIGSFRLTTTHGGYTLLLANNDSLYDHFETSWSRSWDETSFFDEWAKQKASAQNELAEDGLAQSIAWQTIQNRPWDFAKSCLIRVGWLWAPWPNQSSRTVQTAIGLWYCTLYALAIVGGYQALRHGRSSIAFQQATWLLASVLLSVTCVHAVYWSNMRMRAVCIPSLAIFAALPLLPFASKENTTPTRSE